jgi:BolA protein
MSTAAAIESKLRAGLAPVFLEIIDESAGHQGHGGARPGGETHFRVEIVADAFAGRSRVERQRLVYALLKDELAGRVHALSIAARTPAEAGV